jgi:hypothetical protein
MKDRPRFPLTVEFSDGETLVVEDNLDAERNLEWLDTDDPQDPVQVQDALGRPVRLRIEGLRIKALELLQQ